MKHTYGPCCAFAAVRIQSQGWVDELAVVVAIEATTVGGREMVPDASLMAVRALR
jgi:hypothetical protein